MANKYFNSKIISIPTDLFRRGKINVIKRSSVLLKIPQGTGESYLDYQLRVTNEIPYLYNVELNNTIVISDEQYKHFHDSYANYKENKLKRKNVILIGGVGSGKSYLNMAAFFYYMSISKKRRVFAIFGATITIAKQIYMPIIRSYSGLFDLKEPSNNTNDIQLGNHIIRFYGCKNDGDASKFRGANLDAIIATEPTLFLYENLQELIKRSRDGYIYWDTNPDDKNNPFIRYMEGKSMNELGLFDSEDNVDDSKLIAYVDELCDENNLPQLPMTKEEAQEEEKLQEFKVIQLNIYENDYAKGGFLNARSYIKKILKMCKSQTDIDRFIRGIPSSDEHFPFAEIAKKDKTVYYFDLEAVDDYKVVMFIDPAYSDKTTGKVDSTAVTILWKFYDDKKYYLQGYLFRGNWAKESTLKDIAYLCEFFDVSELWMERNHLDIVHTADVLLQYIDNEDLEIHIVNSPSIPKKDRIKNIDVLFGGLSVFCDISINKHLDNVYDKYLYEISNFSFDTRNEHDDAPDSWEACVRAYNSCGDKNVFKSAVYQTVPDMVKADSYHIDVGSNYEDEDY